MWQIDSRINQAGLCMWKQWRAEEVQICVSFTVHWPSAQRSEEGCVREQRRDFSKVGLLRVAVAARLVVGSVYLIYWNLYMFRKACYKEKFETAKGNGPPLLLKLRCLRTRAPPQFILYALNKTVINWARCRLSKASTFTFWHFHASCYKDMRLIFNSKTYYLLYFYNTIILHA